MMLRHLCLLAASGGLVGFALQPASAATFDFNFLAGGVPTANGQFSFSDTLLGGTVSASQLSAFNITFDPGPSSSVAGSFATLGSAAAPPPLAETLSAAGFPYFEYNSAANTFVPFVISPSEQVLIRGGQPTGVSSFRAFNLLVPTPGAPGPGIFVENEQAVGSNFESGTFDTITIDPAGGSVVPAPEPDGVLAFGIGLLGVAIARLTTLARRAAT